MFSLPPSNLERAFFVCSLRDNLDTRNIRLDGRDLLEFREPKIEPQPTKYHESSTTRLIRVSLGDTVVFALTTIKEMEPSMDRPTEGSVQYYVTESPTLKSQFKDDSVSSEEVYQRLIEKLFKNSRYVDTESLIIKPGEKAFSVRVDLNLQSVDGSVCDCLCLATAASLLLSKRPSWEVVEDSDVDGGIDGEENIRIDWSMTIKAGSSLVLHNTPILSTFLIINPSGNQEQNGTEAPLLLADPSLQEEECLVGWNGPSTSKLFIALNRQGEIILLEKSGGPLLPTMEWVMDEGMRLAQRRTNQLMDLITFSITNHK